jgi:hypothetical protein
MICNPTRLRWACVKLTPAKPLKARPITSRASADIRVMLKNGRFVRAPDMQHCPNRAVAANVGNAGCDRSKLIGRPAAALGRSCRSTPSAESVHSLQVRGRRASMATADIQAATDHVLVLRQPKSAWSPNRPIPRNAQASANIENSTLT